MSYINQLKWVIAGTIASMCLGVGLASLSRSIRPASGPIITIVLPDTRTPERIQTVAPTRHPTQPIFAETALGKISKNIADTTPQSNTPQPDPPPTFNPVTNGSQLEDSNETRSGIPANIADSTPPIVHYAPRPRYPEVARKQGFEGSVGLQIKINPDGTIRAVDIIRPSLYPVLDRAARDGVKRWQFVSRSSQPQMIEVSIEFKLE